MLIALFYGGSVLGMIISLKNNARPRKKPFETIKEEYKNSLHKHYGLQYKEVSHEELAKIKQKIRQKFRNEERIRYLRIAAYVLFICALLFIAVSFQLKRNKEIQRQSQEVRKINAMTPAEQFENYLNSGHQFLNEEKYNDAKTFSFLL